MRAEWEDRDVHPLEQEAAGVEEAVAKGELKFGVEPDGVAALPDGLLLGISIVARDGGPNGTIDAAISSAFFDWRSDL